MTLLPFRHSASVNGRRSASSFVRAWRSRFERVMHEMTRFLPWPFSTRRPSSPDVRGAHQYALARLRHDLPPTLHYHALPHTLDDVLPAVERLAALSGITGRNLDLLRTAAVFHDIGYIHTRINHEAASIAIARTVLPRFGFSRRDIAEITGMIEATKLPQTPRTLSEAILADADLDSLGRDDCFIRGEQLRRENAAYGHATTEQEWCEQQHRFLCAHTFHTPAAHALRDAQKLRNIELLLNGMERLAERSPDPLS